VAGPEPSQRSDRERYEDAWMLAIANAVAEPRPLPLDAAEEPRGPSSAARPDERPPARCEIADGAAEGDGDGDAGADPRAAREATGKSGPRQAREELKTVIRDERLGRLELSVSREPSGLRIVINVADAHVKSLIESERLLLSRSLEECGLAVSSVQIRGVAPAGTGLALDRGTARDRARSFMSPRLENPKSRSYRGTLEDDLESDSEGVSFKA
jgi:hypothetical protein